MTGVVVVQRYFAKNKIGDKFILDSGDIHHISNVMRMKNGEFIEVVYNSILYKCKVLFSDGLEVLYDSILDDKNVSDKYICLIVPVLKEQKMDYILQKSTELGVSEIIPIVTERCVVKVSSKEDKKLIRWNKIVKEASEQSKRLDVPIISSIRNINDLCFSSGVKLVCSTRENEKNIKKILQTEKKCDRMYIVVGPEGGLSIFEEKKLNELGFISVSLGNRIMRVETVPLYILSVLNYEFME